MRYKHLIFLLFISLGSSIFAQLSKTHYIPPLTSSDGFTDQYIYISTPKNSNVSYKITAIGQPDLAQYSGVVSNGSPVEQAVLDNGGAPIFSVKPNYMFPIRTFQLLRNLQIKVLSLKLVMSSMFLFVSAPVEVNSTPEPL